MINTVNVVPVILDEYGLPTCSKISIVVNSSDTTQLNDLINNNSSNSSISDVYNDLITNITSLSTINIVTQTLYANWN